jgi:hypothetical protein
MSRSWPVSVFDDGDPGHTYIFGRADFAVGTGAISIAAGDFNRDGNLDLAVTNGTSV